MGTGTRGFFFSCWSLTAGTAFRNIHGFLDQKEIRQGVFFLIVVTYDEREEEEGGVCVIHLGVAIGKRRSAPPKLRVSEGVLFWILGSIFVEVRKQKQSRLFILSWELWEDQRFFPINEEEIFADHSANVASTAQRDQPRTKR